MKTVQVRTLAPTRLSMDYARRLEGNKIKHYYVRLSAAYAGTDSESHKEMLEAQISKEEGEQVIVEILPCISNTNANSSVLQIKDVSEVLLKDHPSILKALKQVKINSTLHQYAVNLDPLKAKYLSPITSGINRVLGIWNSWMKKLQVSKTYDRFEYLDSLSKVRFLIPLIPAWGLFRYVTPVKFISVGFEESDLEAASNALIADLKTLNDQGLIMGHLALPSMVPLADTLGSGELSYALIAFVFTDDRKIQDIYSKNGGEGPVTMKKKYLDVVGVKNETFEGDIAYLDNIDLRSKYEIEEISLGNSLSPVDALQAALDFNEKALE